MDSGPEWIVNPGAHVARLTGGELAVDALTVCAPARGRGMQSLVVEPDDPLHDVLVRILLLREPLGTVPLEPRLRDRLAQAGVLVRAGHAPSAVAFRCEGDPSAIAGWAAVAPPERLAPGPFAAGAQWYRDRQSGVRTPWWGGDPVSFDPAGLQADLEAAAAALGAGRVAELSGLVPLAQVEATARYFQALAAAGALAIDASRGRSESRDDHLAAFWSRELAAVGERLTGGPPLAPLQASCAAFRAGSRVDGAVAEGAELAGIWCLAYDGVEVGLLPPRTGAAGGAVPTRPGALALWRPDAASLDVLRVPPGRALTLLLMSWGGAR